MILEDGKGGRAAAGHERNRRAVFAEEFLIERKRIRRLLREQAKLDISFLEGSLSRHGLSEKFKPWIA